MPEPAIMAERSKRLADREVMYGMVASGHEPAGAGEGSQAGDRSQDAAPPAAVPDTS
jgi:hypothetical protein